MVKKRELVHFGMAFIQPPKKDSRVADGAPNANQKVLFQSVASENLSFDLGSFELMICIL